MHCSQVYLASGEYVPQLVEELEREGIEIAFVEGRLVGVHNSTQPRLQEACEGGGEQGFTPRPFLSRGRKWALYGWHQGVFHPMWAENIWYEPHFLPICSISDGAKQLKAMQRNWVLYPFREHRRGALLAEQLPKVSAKPLQFGQAPLTAPLGAFALWSRDVLLASPRCYSPFPHGQAQFLEDKHNPPNRAYLKLWEAFTRLGMYPGSGDLCLDFGSSPGGWTWVLASLGARVYSVDKAPLVPHIAHNPLVEVCQGSAFGLEPRYVGAATWLFSDMACYPDRLLDLVRRYRKEYPTLHMLCTIKLAGKTDFAALDAFLEQPDSFIFHLSVNKHEVTWVSLGETAPDDTEPADC